MRLGLYVRQTTINSIIMGMTTYGYTFSFHQAAVQRITTQRTLRHAKGVMYANLVGTCAILLILFLSGIGIYAVYYGCDPISMGLVKKFDQITPFYVMQHLGFLTGVPGLFVACLFCGTLSSISSLLNAVPTMMWNDFLVKLPYFKRTSEKTKTILNKLMTLVLGVVMIGLAFLASRAEGVFRVGISVFSIIAGPYTGVFVMGLALPIVGKKGATAGFLASIAFISWIVIGAQLYGEPTPVLPLHKHLCVNTNVTQMSNATTEMPSPMPATPKTSHPLWFLHNISNAYFCFIGTLVCLVVGLIVTFATGCEELSSIQPEHVIHCLRHKVGRRNAENSVELESFLDDAHLSKHIRLKSKT